MLGATGVGKTSLVRRYVESMFSEKYQATIGVKIDRKLVDHDGGQISLLLWDLQGEDDLQRVRLSYLRGAAGLIYVVDGTREETLDRARSIQQGAQDTVGAIPAILLVNKSDLAGEWRISDGDQGAKGPQGVEVFKTSARTGDNVEEAFAALVRKIQAT